MKKCPFCAEEIQEEAIKCKHCGENLTKVVQSKQQISQDELEEKVLKEEKPALRSYAGFLLIGFLLLFLYGIGLLIIIGVIIHRNSIRYTITNMRVKTQKGIIGRRVDEIDIKHIRGVSLRQDFSAKILGYGDVLVGTAATGTYEVNIEKVNHPQDIMALIKSLQNK